MCPVYGNTEIMTESTQDSFKGPARKCLCLLSMEHTPRWSSSADVTPGKVIWRMLQSIIVVILWRNNPGPHVIHQANTPVSSGLVSGSGSRMRTNDIRSGFKSQAIRRAKLTGTHVSWARVYVLCYTSGCTIGISINCKLAETALVWQSVCESSCQNVVVCYLSYVHRCDHAYTIRRLYKVSSPMMGMWCFLWSLQSSHCVVRMWVCARSLVGYPCHVEWQLESTSTIRASQL